MISPAGLTAKPQTEFVALSYRGFALWWVAIFLIHLVTCLFNACYAKFYWIFGSTQLSFSLDKYDVGISREYFHTISYVHIALACLDGGLLLLMVVGSLRKRTLVFSPWSESAIKRKQARNRKNVVVRDQIGPLYHVTKRKTSIPILRRASATYANIANRRGALGVNGRYFYVIIVCREVVETAFQTEQAFRMSRYMSRFVLNRFYVSLLVINCWSPVLIHTRVLEKDEARRRLAAIVLDCALDLMSAMGVSIMIVITYVNEFDQELMGFSYELLDNDNWFAQMLDEARIVLVSSWLDLISRAVFGLGIIITTASMKQLLRWKPIHKIDPRGPSTAELKQRESMIPLDTRESIQTSGKNYEHSGGYSCLIPRIFWCNNVHFKNRARHVLFQTVRLVFFAWGVVILTLHIQATRQIPLLECSPKVYPMAGFRPACFAVEFDCNRMKISGGRAEVATQLQRFDHTTVVKLHILHCSNLEIPEMFQEFKRLHEIWIYNSTIREWGPEAAVTNSCHPNLTVLSMIRTNMTDGRLPVGLQSVDFPINLTEFYFCETNLRTLPDDIDDIWNLNTSISIENSQLSVVPLSLVRLQPHSLSLAGNPIRELPPDIFETPAIQNIILHFTNVAELPQNVLNPPLPPTFIDLTGTNVAFFWSWIDPFIERMIKTSPRIVAGGTPYCSDWDAIFRETKSDFSVPFRQGYSNYLMNASKANRNILQHAIDCTTNLKPTQFNIEWWDSTYGLEA